MPLRTPLALLLAAGAVVLSADQPLRPDDAGRQARWGLGSADLTVREAVPARLLEGRELSREELAQMEAQILKVTTLRRNKVNRKVPVNPEAVLRPGAPLIPETRIAGERPADGALLPAFGPPVSDAGLTIFKNTTLKNLSGSKSQINEPATAEGGSYVFYTGNWYAAVSSNGGDTFTFLNPYSTFPASHGGFCCDQDVIYDPGTGLFLWYLQYVNDSNGNLGRLAYTTNPAGSWKYVDITPESGTSGAFAATDWLDYPHMGLSSNYVYITSNVFSSSDQFTGSQIIRLSLQALRNSTGNNQVTATKYWEKDYDVSVPVQGATSTMYFSTHVDNSRMRIYSWPESGAVTSVDVTHAAFNPDGYACKDSASSLDPCQRLDSRNMAGWVSGGKIGVMWPSAQGTTGLGTFNWPYVQVLVVNESTKAIVADTAQYANDRAFITPSAGVNGNGDVGGTMFWAGGAFKPSFGVWISDSGAGSGPFPFALQTVTGGTGLSFGSQNRWGDYLRTRRSTTDPAQFVATGFTMATSSSVDPRYLRFGRGSTATAPSITGHPSSVTVTAPATATFSVTASGTAPLSYQWQKNGAAISGATSASYTTPATSSADNGATFRCVVTNSAGSATSNNATLTVNTSATAPTITSHPASQTVTAPATATFSVTASGTAPLSYQWQKNGAAISGATSASYTTPATSSADNGATFRCVVTNSAGSATSNNATLTVNTGGGTFDEAEPNDTLAGADAVASTFTAIRGYHTATGNPDYFSLVLTPGQKITIAMTGPSGPDWDLALKNSAGTNLASSTGSTTTENLSYTNSGSTNLTVYAHVYVYSGTSTSPYNLGLTYTTPPPVTTYNEVEANNSISAANTVADNVTKVVGYIGSSTDNDYFRLNVAAGRTLNVAMTGPTGSTYDYDLYFYNASGTQLASGTGATTTENVSWTNSGSTTAVVYVAVKRYAGSSTTTPYNLNLTR